MVFTSLGMFSLSIINEALKTLRLDIKATSMETARRQAAARAALAQAIRHEEEGGGGGGLHPEDEEVFGEDSYLLLAEQRRRRRRRRRGGYGALEEDEREMGVEVPNLGKQMKLWCKQIFDDE